MPAAPDRRSVARRTRTALRSSSAIGRVGRSQRRLTDGLSAEQRHRLDALTQRREETSQSWLAWLRQMPEAAKPAAMLGLIERLEHVRAIGLDPMRGHRVHQARLAQLAREAGRTTAQHIAGYERQRRHATLVAVTLDLAASLTDQAVDLFDRLVGTMFRKAEERHARAFQADGRAINEKVRLYARVGAALIAARDDKQDPFDAITAVIPWERFRATVAEAEALARSEEFDAYQMLGEHYAGIRRWAPAFLDAFVFESVPAAASLMRAIEMLREMNRKARPSLPKSAPTGFIRERWARHVLPGGDDRPALLRALRAVGIARPVARRRRLGGRQPAISLLRGTPDLPRNPAGAAAGRHLADRGRRRLRALHRRSPSAARRAAGGDRRQGEGRLAARRHARQGRAEDHADREIDAAGGRGPRRAPLRHAAAHPHHRPAVGGGALDAVHRLLHPSAHRRDRRRPAAS